MTSLPAFADHNKDGIDRAVKKRVLVHTKVLLLFFRIFMAYRNCGVFLSEYHYTVS